jgi:hypothetical protein
MEAKEITAMAKTQAFPPGGHRPSVPLSKTIHRMEPISHEKLRTPFGQAERETAEKRARAPQKIPFKDGS